MATLVDLNEVKTQISKYFGSTDRKSAQDLNQILDETIEPVNVSDLVEEVEWLNNYDVEDEYDIGYSAACENCLEAIRRWMNG